MDDELNKVNDAVNDAADTVNNTVETVETAVTDATPVVEAAVTDAAQNAQDAAAAIPQAVAPVAPAPADGGKKKKKKGSIFGWIIVLIAIAGVAYYFFTMYNPEFEINGYKFTMKASVSDLEKNNIVLCDTNGKILDSHPSLPGKTVNMGTSYHLGVKNGSSKYAKLTGFVVYLGNFGSTNSSDLQIFRIWYYPASTDSSVTVKISGQTFTGATIKDAEKLIKDAKIPFKAKDIKAFADGSDDSIFVKSGKNIRMESKDGKIYRISFERDVKTTSK